jgi:glycosyltransferase involved in cell wall biosynthesis
VKTLIVLPAFNEAATISDVVTSLTPLGHVVVVDDCSNDGTAAIAETAGAHVVRHKSNKGYDGALNSGFAKAAEMKAEYVYTFDADGQHGVEALMAAIRLFELDNKLDLVIGQRPETARLAEALFSVYTKFRFGIRDILCGLKGYRLSLYQKHGTFDTSQMIGTELTLASISRGANWTTFPVPVAPRQDAPRFGSTIRANMKIFKAMTSAIAKDIRGHWRPGTLHR